MILNHTGRVPPSDGIGHWRYPVAPGVILRAKGYDALKELVFQYRLRNNIDPGDVDRDISTYYCDQYPTFCHAEARDTNPEAYTPPTEPILNRVSRWASVLIHRMPKGGYPLVTKVEAERRAAICLTCPKQDGSWRGGCGGCSATTMQLLSQIKQLKATSHDGNLGACRVLGSANAVAVWLEPEASPVTAEQHGGLPAFCWRKSAS